MPVYGGIIPYYSAQCFSLDYNWQKFMKCWMPKTNVEHAAYLNNFTNQKILRRRKEMRPTWRHKLKVGHNIFFLHFSSKPSAENAKTISSDTKHPANCGKDQCKQFQWNPHRVVKNVLIPAGHEQGQRRTPDSGERPVD